MLVLSNEKGNDDSIRLRQNHPFYIKGDIINAKNLNPDLIAALQALLESSGKRIGASQEKALHWFWHIMPFLVEGKDWDSDVWDAQNGFRMLNAGMLLISHGITYFPKLLCRNTIGSHHNYCRSAYSKIQSSAAITAGKPKCGNSVKIGNSGPEEEEMQGKQNA